MELADRIRKDKRVQELETDPDIFVTLKPGFRFSTDPVHCFGEETLSDVLRSLTLVQECNCNQCEKERDNGKETTNTRRN